MNELKVGILGCGKMGRVYADCFSRNPHTRVTAFYNRTYSRAEALAAEYEGSQAMRTWQEITEDADLDIIGICTPSHEHLEQMSSAIEAGKHVMCEKPMARNAEECRRMCKVASASSVKVAVGFQMRFHPVIRKVDELLPRIGTLFHIDFVFGMNRPEVTWRHKSLQGGGVLKELGMSPEECSTFERILGMPHGIVLVTGPTGSGKTTTLYAALSRINDVERKIITIEDPVEYHLRGINQIQVSTKSGLVFSRGLRSILRHDPDVILIGEIRDRETADIAVQASLTGHLVFSTLHTNDAPGALTRLVDMGIEPYLVASSLEAVLAQRLVRLICPHCREEVEPADRPALEQEFAADVPDVLYRGRGCRECQGTGYRGRAGIFEMMLITDEIRALILEHASAGEIRRSATERGMKSLRQDGWRHVAQGKTTIEEVLRVTKDERLNGNGAGSSFRKAAD